MNTNMLKELAAAWLAAKKEEGAANRRRIEIEERIVALTGKKDEGAQAHEADGFNVTVTGKVTRKMDWAAWEKVKGRIPANLRPVKTKPELDEKGVKYLQANEPKIYAMLPITVTPAKTAIDVKEIM